jgi:hypothetical protein
MKMFRFGLLFANAIEFFFLKCFFCGKSNNNSNNAVLHENMKRAIEHCVTLLSGVFHLQCIVHTAVFH